MKFGVWWGAAVVMALGSGLLAGPSVAHEPDTITVPVDGLCASSAGMYSVELTGENLPLLGSGTHGESPRECCVL